MQSPSAKQAPAGALIGPTLAPECGRMPAPSFRVTYVVRIYVWKLLRIKSGAQLRLLISGDQVLPEITSNVSVFPTGPDADPLTDWLESLASIRSRVPDDVLALPSHNKPFRGLHARLEQLIQGHARSLQSLRESLDTPQTAVQVFNILFRRPVNSAVLAMASGESAAHMNCLMRSGQMVRQTDDAGFAWYRSVGR